jgi:hypothetical protein
MTNEPRKASEVLLEMEVKIDSLIGLVKAQNFANQLLSNKVTDLIKVIITQQQITSPQIRVESVNTLPQTPSISPMHNFIPVDPEKQIPIMAESKLPQTNEPIGFRRTSRPETFIGDDAHLDPQPPLNESVKMPLQIPRGAPPGRGGPEIIIPAQQPQQPQQSEQPLLQKQSVMQNAVPVVQRVVNSDGKSIFLANVEIMDLSNSQIISTTRTTGTGKWMASLGAGKYQVTIRKKETSTTGKMEAVQNIQVDGSQSPLELKTIIIK